MEHKATMIKDAQRCPQQVAGAMSPDGNRRNATIQTKQNALAKTTRVALTHRSGGYKAWVPVYIPGVQRTKRAQGRVVQEGDDWIFIPDDVHAEMFEMTTTQETT